MATVIAISGIVYREVLEALNEMQDILNEQYNKDGLSVTAYSLKCKIDMLLRSMGI